VRRHPPARFGAGAVRWPASESMPRSMPQRPGAASFGLLPCPPRQVFPKGTPDPWWSSRKRQASRTLNYKPMKPVVRRTIPQLLPFSNRRSRPRQQRVPPANNSSPL